MKTAVFLQVRLDSSRLPQKALLSLGDRTVIELAMDSLRNVDADIHALLTDHNGAEVFAPYAKPYGFAVYEGSKNDVLARFAEAATYFGIDRYYRATGDNPLVSAKLAMALMKHHKKGGADFSGFLGPPLGTGVEITEAQAILIAHRESSDPYEREHVSPFLYKRPERFVIKRPWAQEINCLPDAKVTLDTRDDYRKLEIIYNSVYKGKPIETDTLVAWLKEHDSSGNRNGSENSIHTLSNSR